MRPRLLLRVRSNAPDTTHRPTRRHRPSTPRRILAGLLVAALAVTPVQLLTSAPAQAAPVDTLRAAAIPLAAAPRADAPMRMTVGSASPLLLTQLNIGNDLGHTPGFKRNYNSGWSMAQLWASVPDDVKHNIGFVLHQGHTALSDNNTAMSAAWLEDNVREADSLGIPVFILWGEGITKSSSKFSFTESLYQRYPHFMGTVVSELTSTLGDLDQALQLANNYGGFHVLGSLEEGNLLANRLENQTNWNTAARYAKNFIFNPKNFHENFEAVNAWTQGAWLAGAFDNWGPYFDGYPYYGCGYFAVNPGSYSNCGDRWSRSIAEPISSMMMLDQWQNGATVFHLENQLDIPTTGSLFSPYFYQSILPAIRHILTQKSPTRDEVISRTKVAYSETGGAISTLGDSTSPGRSGNPNRTTFYSMYEKSPSLTAVQKGLWFYLRSNGRYNIIPRIPARAPSSLLTRFDTVLTKSSYDPALYYGDARNALFNSRYPQISTGEAFVQKAGANWLVYNTNDRDNFTEDANLLLGGSTFSRLEMPEITPHTWAAVTESGSAISVLLDNFRTDREADLLKPGGTRDMEFNRNFVKYAYVPNPQDAALRTTTMRFDVATRPTLTISGYDRNRYTYTEQWNPNSHTYSLVVRHNGVVNIKLTTANHEGGWTSVPGTSSQIVSSTGAKEYTFDGTSVAWTVPTGSTGTARALIDGVTFAPSVALSGGGTVFRATGLSNSVHTLRLEGSSLPIQTLAHVPSVEHTANSIETNDFNYGSEAADEDVLYGSEGWRVIDGKLKLVGFVFPFYGDTTVYNTNAKLTNLRYEAKINLIHGTSGALVFRANEDTKQAFHFRLDPSRTAEGRSNTASTSCQLMADYGTTSLASCPSSLTLKPDQEYSVVVTASGNTITASINGSQVLSYTATGAYAGRTGYTGLRAPQMQTDAGYRLGQFVQLDDVKVTDLDNGRVAYQSGFDSWSQARGWMTETPLVFDWHQKPDPRSSFTFPWRWQISGGSWGVVENNTFTSGQSGYYAATAAAGTDLVALGGGEAGWATDGGYDSWAWLRVTRGDQAALVVRARDNANMYQARIDTRTGTVSFGKRVNGTWTTLASAPSPVPLAANTWQLVKVTAHGSLLTVLVGGKPALSVRDTTFASGATGVWVPAGGTANVEDARVVARPTDRVTAARPTATLVPADGISGRHITGYDQVAVKTARTKQPALPGTVTARYSDNTKGSVAVTWPAISATQLATATTPTKAGTGRGRFTIQGTVAGTSLTVPVLVTVMPNLTTTFTITGSYSATNRAVPTQTPGTGTFDDGTGGTYTKYLYVRWDTTPDIVAGAPTTQTITGTINGYPWEKVTARISVTVPSSSAPGAPTAVSATPGSGQVSVRWTAPARNGNSSITGYTVTARPGGATCSTTGATSCTVGGLTNGTAYSFTVTARNAVGTSAASFPSSLVTPR
ncbi:glycosyl hydrolase family 98 C-terminal domain-containing protein [Micromonospora sp. 067-2]|uniref:glycosyl hydrolase family 98 C-terminal domain-containing protein n=1 Tax=Micromonospora sp. 067-2 TaxID=2789270 RepID=UPI003978A9E9